MLVNSTSFLGEFYFCFNSKDHHFISVSVMAVKTVLVLLFSTFILYLGYQQWQQQTSRKAATHSDLFTYHLAAMEMFWCPGFLFYVFGNHMTNTAVMDVGYLCFSLTFYGEVLFHLLTCVERYLAVVHPITYLSFRNARGVRIRNISIGSVWLMSFGLIFFDLGGGENVVIAYLIIAIVSIVAITFCSVSVLCALIGPQIGENAGKKRRINQSKLRAFHTVTAISCVLWLWFGGLFISYALTVAPLFSQVVDCVIIASIGWLNLPNFLVSPMLYLFGAGTFFCTCDKSK